MRSISRVVGVSINTVAKLLSEAGEACAAYHDTHVHHVSAQQIQCDEIWSFCYAKEKNLDYVTGDPEYAGNVWTWTAIDRESRLIISWMISADRDADNAKDFIQDLSLRLDNRIQLSTDGLISYIDAVERAFGTEVDYAQIVKEYGTTPEDGRHRYRGSTKKKISGSPNTNAISTSHMERHNLTTRMCLRRYTRKTNAFSKKLQNHLFSLALYFVWYNFCRNHSTIKKTPAMAAGLAETNYSMEWLLDMIDSHAPKPTGRGLYNTKPRISN